MRGVCQIDLKDENNRKLNILAMVHLEELDDLRIENIVLREDVAKQKNKKNRRTAINQD